MVQSTNEAGLKLIKSFEGCRLKSYKLKGEKYWTIGYGHSFDNSINASTVWTQAQADEHLRKDLKRFEEYVSKYAKQYGFKFNDNQFSALVSYCYNRGPGGVKQLLSNSKTIADVSENIVVYWGSAVRYKNGLINRRKKEKELFDKPVKDAVAPKKESPKPKGKSSSKEEYHTVVPGDNATKIAKKYGTTVASIKKLNPKIEDINLIYPKQKIRVK